MLSFVIFTFIIVSTYSSTPLPSPKGEASSRDPKGEASLPAQARIAGEAAFLFLL
jgi:hypothetical protein